MAAYLIIDRLKSDQMVDVFQTVRRIRESRPQFVETWVRNKIKIKGSFPGYETENRAN